MAAEELVQALLGIAGVYTKRYGVPESLEQLQSIVGSIISVGERAQERVKEPAIGLIAPILATTLALPAAAVEALIQQVVTRLTESASLGEVIDGAVDEAVGRAKQALAEQAYEWRQHLMTEVKETLYTYIQSFAPQFDPGDLPNTIESIIPLVQEGRITRAEVSDLARQMAVGFGTQVALSHGINPRYLKVAQELALCIAQWRMEQAVAETVWAYVQKFEPALEQVSEDLIEKAMGAISSLPVEFDWATELSLKDKRLLIKQVSFKLNIMQASPPSSQTAQELADHLHSEIEQFRQEQALALRKVDVAQGFTSGDGLEISSGWSLFLQDTAQEVAQPDQT